MPRILTYADVLDRLVHWTQGKGRTAENQELRAAVLDAYSDMSSLHLWSYLQRHSRLHVTAPQTITAAYDHTGGTYERQLTVSTSGWDFNDYSWADDGSVYINNVVCDIDFLTPTGLTFRQTNEYDPKPRPRFKMKEWHLTAETPDKKKRMEFVTIYRPHRIGDVGAAGR